MYVILKNELIVFQSCSQGDSKCHYSFCGTSYNNNLTALPFMCRVRENYNAASSGQKWGIERLNETGMGSIRYVKSQKLCRSFQNDRFFLRKMILIYVLFFFRSDFKQILLFYYLFLALKWMPEGYLTPPFWNYKHRLNYKRGVRLTKSSVQVGCYVLWDN